MSLNAIKRSVAGIFDVFGINSLGHWVQRAIWFPFIRVVNYHEISPNHAANFEAHLAYYAKRFVNVNEDDLRAFLSGTPWPYSKPGIILSFDDGSRSHFDLAAPLIEKYGFTGWFFIPAGWIAERMHAAEDIAEAAAAARTLRIEHVRYLDAHHVVGSHTETHCRLRSDVPTEKLKFEILGSKESLEEITGHEVKIFCWVGGEEDSYSKPASDVIRSGYDLGFMTNNAAVLPITNPLQLQRTNIEAENPLPLVRFQLSGLMDLIYSAKRKRVNHLTQ